MSSSSLRARSVCGLFIAAIGAGCSSEAMSGDAAPDGSMDAVSDISATDATADASVLDAPVNDAAVLDGGADGSDATTSHDLDGSWRVTSVRCNGLAANATIQAFITPPNSSSFVVSGTTSSYGLMFTGCAISLQTIATISAPGRASFAASGAWTCSSNACSARCGTTPTSPFVYDYTRTGATLVMTSVGATPDDTCTANGMSNPIEYTYSLQ